MVLNSVLGPDPDNFENCQWSDFCKVKKHLERNYGILGGMKLGWDGYIAAWWQQCAFDRYRTNATAVAPCPYQRQWFGVWWVPVEPDMAVGAMGPPWCLL